MSQSPAAYLRALDQQSVVVTEDIALVRAELSTVAGREALARIEGYFRARRACVPELAAVVEAAEIVEKDFSNTADDGTMLAGAHLIVLKYRALRAAIAREQSRGGRG